MARKSSPTISQEELYPLTDDAVREDLDDARLLDLDVEQESPFLRAQKRVSVRRASLPRKTATLLIWAAVVAALIFLCSIAVASLYHYGERSWRFRVESSDDVEIIGLENVTRAQVMEVMGGDIGRNIFFVPLAQRKVQLEQIPWVKSASVMRFVPNRLKVEIHERTPVAFARVGSRILLVDAAGMLMELPGKKKYSFPVMLGMNPGEPLSTRTARMKIYNDVVSQLDSSGAHYSQELSEVDLSDPEDVKVLANNTRGGVLVHLGSSNYLERYKVYVTHVQTWQQFGGACGVLGVKLACVVEVVPGTIVLRAPIQTLKFALIQNPEPVTSLARNRRRRSMASETVIASTPGSCCSCQDGAETPGPIREYSHAFSPSR